MGEPAIAVTELRKSFGPKEAVAGIDLEIAAGSLAGLVGPNGAGKTTSLSMMTGLLRPDGGRILINGMDMWADPPAAKAVIGVVPAEARLFERLSGEELLEYAGRLRGMPAAEAPGVFQQLLTAEPLEQPGLGRHHPDDRLGGGRVGPHVQPADQDLAAVGPKQAGHHRQRGGLPGPVRPDQPGERSGRDLQVDPGDRLLLAETLAQRADRDGQVSHVHLQLLVMNARCRGSRLAVIASLN